MECDIRVQGAKIATLGERVEDLFWVTHQNSTPLQDEEKNQAVSRQIKLALDPS
jgi:[protein-PII] uridylyltransferase